MRLGKSATTLALAGAISCGASDLVNCVALPCVSTFAIIVTISGATPASVPGAFVQAGGGISVPCTLTRGSTCFVPGAAGRYELDVGAPGYRTVHRSVDVSGTTPACGCASVETQHIDVVLTPAT